MIVNLEVRAHAGPVVTHSTGGLNLHEQPAPELQVYRWAF